MTKVCELTKLNIKNDNRPLVIGFFGCIHKKHKELLTQCKNFNVLIFKSIDRKSQYEIYDLETRIDLIKTYKPNNIYVLDVDLSQTGQDFIEQYLTKISPSKIIVGEDFCFGSDHKNTNDLKKYFSVKTIKYDDSYKTKNIAGLLVSQEIGKANKLLDRNYFYKAKHIRGDKNGRLLGFRTINLDNNHTISLSRGSYASYTYIAKKKYPSITFVGKIESIGNKTTLSIETHILNKKIYWIQTALFPMVKVEFLAFLREPKKFGTMHCLKKAIDSDAKKAIDFFKQITNKK